MKALEVLKHYKKVTANMPHGMPTKRINEAIAELEALQQSKSCKGCKYNVSIDYCEYDESCVRAYHTDHYEPKEQ